VKKYLGVEFIQSKYSIVRFHNTIIVVTIQFSCTVHKNCSLIIVDPLAEVSQRILVSALGSNGLTLHILKAQTQYNYVHFTNQQGLQANCGKGG
jgi:hypothetical protein